MRWFCATAVALLLSAPSPGYAASYAIEGFTLGEQVTGKASFSSYACTPSTDFMRLTRCARAQQRGNTTIASTLLHSEDGIALYLMKHLTGAALTRAALDQEINQLSREIGERPAKVEWSRTGSSNSVFATWGRIQLQDLDQEARELLGKGLPAKRGILVDALGDLKRSAEEYDPIYRITGESGYSFSASFDQNGRGHRHYVAVNAKQIAVRLFQQQLQAILERDVSLPADDYQLWPDVGRITRLLALDTSTKFADETMEAAFERAAAKKLHSHLWAIMPLGPIGHLRKREYSPNDIYGPQTRYPVIHRDMQAFLASNPASPFSAFAYFILGDFEKAIAADNRLLGSDVFHYASAHKIINALVDDALKILHPDNPPDDSNLADKIGNLNQEPELYRSKPLARLVPDFAQRIAAAKPHLQAVLRNPSTPHADDAAYLLGWLAFHESKYQEALHYFEQGLVVGNGDYARLGAMRQAVRTLDRFKPAEQVSIVTSSAIFNQRAALLYAAARSAYRDYDYSLAMDAARRALSLMKIPVEQLPVTTDPKKIEAALQKIDPAIAEDPNISELPYIVWAAADMSDYERIVSRLESEQPASFGKRARAIVLKYSMLLDQDEQSRPAILASDAVHKDLRQALHLIEITLNRTEGRAGYGDLREWLHYRKVRALVVFDPKAIPQAISAMQAEFPQSSLLDDALAEEVFAEGVMLRDVDTAKRTLARLDADYPRGNALDNAYTWMAIVLRCAGRTADAEQLNRTILRRFPGTRHAQYARERMTKPAACGLSGW
jgi:tetratricopeptide (TPR) repeat protein